MRAPYLSSSLLIVNKRIAQQSGYPRFFSWQAWRASQAIEYGLLIGPDTGPGRMHLLTDQL